MVPQISYLDLLELKTGKVPNKRLNEASLSRVYQHVVESGQEDSTFGIVTAWRAGNPQEVNNRNQEELKRTVRGLGLGFFKLVGHWQECQLTDIPYSDCPDDQLQDVTEPTLFVPGIGLEDILELCKRYNQDAVIWSGPETEGEPSLVFRDGSMQGLGKFNPDTIAQAYSTVKGGRNFTFEAVANSQTEVFMEQLFSTRSSVNNVSKPSLGLI